MNSVGIRTWILTIALSIAFVILINASAGVRITGMFLILLIPIIVQFVSNKGIKLFSILFVIALLITLANFSYQTGVRVEKISINSTEYFNGIRQGSIIQAVNNIEIKNLNEFENALNQADKGENSKYSFTTDAGEIIFLSSQKPNFTVQNIPRTNIKTGLDLSGGARALVQPVNVTLSESELQELIEITQNRLNVYGLKDISVRSSRDLSGNRYMTIEIAGATPEDLQELVAQQGKFEAKVGNKTVFDGDKGDISDVCRNDATCAGVTSCGADGLGGYACGFRFAIYLTEDAANKHAQLTNELNYDETGRYLSEKLYLYVDGILTDELFIGADLKGQATTSISIQGSGSATTQEEALKVTRENMNKLQTILITGSLPYQLEIVKLDTISPSLGSSFVSAIIYLGGLVFVLVALSIFGVYRRLSLTGAVVLTMFSETVLTLALAALFNQNLDAPAIAGIIVGIGTGVNDQIIILSESQNNQKESVRHRIKNALFIIFGAFLTIVAAMLPLLFAGAGMLRGFALTTIIGVTVGILVTRPAFAEIVRKIEE